jgi:hypothetical protein
MLKPSLNKSLNMWNSLLVSIYTTPEYRPQEFAGEEFYFATIEEFEIAIDTYRSCSPFQLLVDPLQSVCCSDPPLMRDRKCPVVP